MFSKQSLWVLQKARGVEAEDYKVGRCPLVSVVQQRPAYSSVCNCRGIFCTCHDLAPGTGPGALAAKERSRKGI